VKAKSPLRSSVISPLEGRSNPFISLSSWLAVYLKMALCLLIYGLNTAV
jgi:hypothetical protein